MDLALDGPFDTNEIARRAASLEAESGAVERELEGPGDDALEKTGEEVEGERLAAENERSARLRSVYGAPGLSGTAHKNTVLRRIYASDDA